MTIHTFEKAKPHLLKHEGGYVDHPRDPGGATNLGVTIATLSSWRGRSVSKQDVKNLSVSEAHSIYKARYWDKIKGDSLPSGVDYCTYDFAVNSGPSRSAKYLQRIVGVHDDGQIGPLTIEAANAMDPSEIINRMCDERLAFMKRIKGGSLWKDFGKGWGRRVADVRKVSLGFVDNKIVSVVVPKPKPTPKPILEAVRDADKPLLKSKTNWMTIAQSLAGTVATFFADLDPMVQGLMIVGIFAVGAYMIYERHRKAELSRHAMELVNV